MRTMCLRWIWAVLMAMPVGAAAQMTDGTGPDDDSEGMSAGDGETQSSPAYLAFEEGKRLFIEEKFAEAAEKFREANRLKPSWKLLYNIGQSETAAKHFGLGLEAFEQYLTIGGDDVSAERKKQVLQEIAQLRPIVGFFDIEAPVGATVTVGDIERGETPLPGPLMVAASIDHMVRITRGDTVLLERVARVGGGQHIRIVISEEKEAAPVEPSPEGTGDGSEEGALGALFAESRSDR